MVLFNGQVILTNDTLHYTGFFELLHVSNTISQLEIVPDAKPVRCLVEE